MKLSLKWLSKYTNVTPFLRDPARLADILTSGGLEVEGITDQAKQFDHVVIGHILEKNKHPNADSLTLCLVDVGDGTPKRIVCGAKNHNAGDKIVVALPGAVLPGDFAIKISKIRGEESQGMLCSEKELGLNGESQGIMILSPNATVGESFAKYSKSDDVILDVKVTPNRADCLSHFGLAREIAGLTGEKYEFPLTPFPEGRESTRKLIKVSVEDAERCPRYSGRVVQNVKVGPSPEWLRKSLESVGLRSINNIVDVTNFVMLELGQPLHAFDLAKLEGPQIVVRKAKDGEPFKTLDGKDLSLDGTELVICDAKKPVALAGVMGGLNSGIHEYTRDVFVESAYFLPVAVRKSSRRHGIETDSSYRFSRGVDPDSVNLALNRACQLLSEIAQGIVCTDSYDLYPRPVAKPRVELDLTFISARLGFTVESIEAKRLLERVGCDVSGSGTKLLVNPPPYRSDLRIPEDLGEEILRLKGFASVPEKLPQFSSDPTNDAGLYTLEHRMIRVMQSLGLNQAVNLSLTSSKFQTAFYAGGAGNAFEQGVDFAGPAIEIKNPLNIELNVLRLGLLPSLARNALHNLRHQTRTGGLFEIAPVFRVKESKDIREETRPFTEVNHLAGIIWGEAEPSWLKAGNAPLFFRLKGAIEEMLKALQFKSYKFEALKEAPGFVHPGQSARLVVEGKSMGVLGVLHPMVADELEFKDTGVCVFEFNFETLMQGQPRLVKVKPLPKFPSSERDVALLCPTALPSGEVRQELLKAAGPLAQSCEVFDLYMGDKLEAGKKSVAFRLTYLDPQKTLSDDEINAAHQKGVSKVCEKLGLSIR